MSVSKSVTTAIQNVLVFFFFFFFLKSLSSEEKVVGSKLQPGERVIITLTYIYGKMFRRNEDE